jgi:hypothetical protein
MGAVPAVTPLTTPVPAPTVAIVVAPELHDPPVVASVKAVAAPGHTVSVPVMAAGSGFTVTVFTTTEGPHKLNTV